MVRMRVVVLSLLLVLPAAGQNAANVVVVPAKQIDTDIHKAPSNDMGESEINLIERTSDHAAILLRRTAPGKAEVHETETDVWYVVDGGCTFVSGGSLIGGAQISPGQIRGSGIAGGDERKIAKGDFIRVPAAVPHWVKKIEGKEIVYIVVKYTAAK
jgi:mannose-6-phosphate isomerase-like protein (cupin superfamily)